MPRSHQSQRVKRREENLLFLKQLLKNPRSLGALAPSSPKLAEFICQHISVKKGQLIVEIGAGTGRFTQALIKAGVSPQQLAIVELDEDMCDFLRKNFPEVRVIHGNASFLAGLLPQEWCGNVDTVLSGIPMMNLNEKNQRLIVESCLSVLSPEGTILQFTYGPLSPLPAKKFSLSKERLGHVLLNIPPATVWRYRPLLKEERFEKNIINSRLKKLSRLKDSFRINRNKNP